MRPTLALLALSSFALFGCAGDRCCRPCPPPCAPPGWDCPDAPAPTPPAPSVASAPAPARPVLRTHDVHDLVTPKRSIDALADAARARLPSDAIVAAQGQSVLIAKATPDAQTALHAWLQSERAAAGLPTRPAGAGPAPAPVRPAFPVEAEVPRLVVYDVSDLVGSDDAARAALFGGLRRVVPAIQSLELKDSAVVARGTSGEQRAIAAWLAAKRQEAAAPK